MKFRASAEVFRLAFPATDKARRCVEPFLNAAFAKSSLNAVEAVLRYIPIVMPEGMKERYPSRSKLRKKEGIYDCAPQLDYEVFVHGRLEDQLREYLRGVALSAPHLADLGVTKEQIEEFKAIVGGAAESILAERPDQTLH